MLDGVTQSRKRSRQCLAPTLELWIRLEFFLRDATRSAYPKFKAVLVQWTSLVLSGQCWLAPMSNCAETDCSGGSPWPLDMREIFPEVRVEYRFRFLDGEEEAESKEGACAKANIRRGEWGKESLTEMIVTQNMKQKAAKRIRLWLVCLPKLRRAQLSELICSSHLQVIDRTSE